VPSRALSLARCGAVLPIVSQHGNWPLASHLPGVTGSRQRRSQPIVCRKVGKGGRRSVPSRPRRNRPSSASGPLRSPAVWHRNVR
jgi:hypothetical protein